MTQAIAEERNQRGSAVLQPLVESLAVIGAMLLVGGAQVVLIAHSRMTIVALMAFGVVLLRLVPIAKGFYSTQAQALFYYAGGVDVVMQWLNTPQFPALAFGTTPVGRLAQGISIRNLQFSYEPPRVVVADLSLDIRAKQLVAVVGPSGSGKSTLAALLLRLYEPQAGTVLVDGRDYWSFDDASWHQFVAFVEQEPFIFNDTVAANVAYGYSAATDEDIVRALAVAQLDDFVEALPRGLDTELGERGVAMSGGQRQRLAIARAIVRNPQLLILDEATSHLDTISESRLQRALLTAAHGRTTLVIAHRLSTIKQADQIVVMSEGAYCGAGAMGRTQGGRRCVSEPSPSRPAR